MSFVDEENCYERTIIKIDKFQDGSKDLFEHVVTTVFPPCAQGGCRNSHPDMEHCEFDPKRGLCGGRMA